MNDTGRGDRASHVARTFGGALLVACSSLAILAVSYKPVLAQSAQTLPPVTIEPPKAVPKAAPKPEPKAAEIKAKPAPVKRVAKPATPAPAPVEPAAEEAPVAPAVTPENATTGAARDGAMQTQVYSTPGSVSSVGSDALSTFGGDTGDVLRSIPGTSVRENANNPGLAVNIRGMEGSGRVNMMIDGVRQSFGFTGHEAQGFAYVDPSLLAGIDIARGSVSTTGGAGALAGTANFRTLDVIDVLRPGQNVGVLTTTSYGTNGQNWTGMAAGAISNGPVSIVGAISGRNPENFKNGDGKEVPFTGQDLTSGLVKGEFKFGDGHKVKIGGMFYDNDFVANSYYQNISTNTLTFNYSYKPVNNNWIDLKVNASRNDVEMTYKRPYITSAFLTASGRDLEDIGKGFDVSNVSTFRLGAILVRSENGYEYFHDDVTAINSTLVPNRGVNGTGEKSIDGLFSSNKFSYGIVDFIAAGRYDSFQLKGSGSVAANNPLGMPAGAYTIDRDDSRFNPAATLAFRLTPWFNPYVKYSEGMRAPTVNEVLMGGSHPGAGPAQSFFPNPFLQPETQKGWEVGFNTDVSGVFTSKDRLNFKGDYYDNDVQDYVTACFGKTGGSYFCNNFGTTQVRGVEMQGMYDTGFFFLGGSYAWIESNLPSQVNGLGGQSYQPEHVATLSGGVRLFDQRWTLGARGYYASEAYVGSVNLAPNGTHYTDGYTLLDLFTKYKVSENLEVGATVTNVGDVAYTPATSTPGTGGFNGQTGQGRTALFTLRSQW